MPLDKSFTGRSYPPGDVYEVGRAKIREFADAVGAVSPLHRDPQAARAAGYADVIAPPTFATIISMTSISIVVDDPELGLDYSRVVHGAQTFVHHRPMVAGDRLVTAVHVDDVQTRMGNDFLTVRAEIETEAGEAVCTSTGLLVARGEDA
ncbi:MaoC family dehydratase N-terminal domain-containing protein [Kutzneria sp. CA-103260]|uniref:MaoC family dehydratase N-terminal domain-containing protein n=1 Tax=Kutzneria sp. CA-103260 TaxID=2802641 RepID=UPI001BA70154|nr:MaoC family dehydratase N-terminal domain-containing protein [Kutzneria sp. CA-103260]